MKNYDKNKESLCLMYLDANNLYGWAMSQKLHIDGFKWKYIFFRFSEDFIKNYDENSDNGHILEVDFEYPKELLFNKHKDLPFLPGKMKTKLNGPEKLVCNINNKKNFAVHIRSLKQALNHGLILKEVHNVIEFNQEAWLKPCIEMNTKLIAEAKNDSGKDFFKLMNNAVFGKTIRNGRNDRDIKLVTTNKRRNQLVSEPNYRTKNGFQKIC